MKNAHRPFDRVWIFSEVTGGTDKLVCPWEHRTGPALPRTSEACPCHQPV